MSWAVTTSTFTQPKTAMSRNEINDRPSGKPFSAYQDKSFPKAENEKCASVTFTIQKLNEGLADAEAKEERIYTPTYTQLLINCLRREENLIIIRDFINGKLTKDLTDAIDNETPVTKVCDDVAGRIRTVVRQEGEKILRAHEADFAGQVPTDPTAQKKKLINLYN